MVKHNNKYQTRILSIEDIEDLNIDLSKLELICGVETEICSAMTTKGVDKKLFNKIQELAFKQDAAYAVIQNQTDMPSGIMENRSYFVKYYSKQNI